MSKLSTVPAHPETAFRDTRGQDVSRPPPKASRRNWVIAAIALIVLILICIPLWRWLSVGGASVRASELRFASVERGDFVADVSGYAQVVAARAPTLFAAQAGTVLYQVDAGEAVSKGQPLAQIESPELINRLAQEQSALDAARAEAAQARIDNQRALLTKERARDEAQIRATAAQREFERAEKAFAVNAISQVEYRRADDLVQAAAVETGHTARELALEKRSLDLQLTNKLSQVERQALVVAELQRQRDALTMLAPFDGVVGERAQADRAAVLANAPLLTLVDLGAFELDLSLSELYAQRLAPGQEASVERGGKTFAAVIKRVSPEVSGGQIKVRAAFAGEPPADLKQNQRVLVRVELDSRSDALTVARGAFLDDLGGNAAWVRGVTTIERRPIELGLVGADRVEVLSGLNEGDEVVLSLVKADADTNSLYLHQ